MIQLSYLKSTLALSHRPSPYFHMPKSPSELPHQVACLKFRHFT